MAAKEDAGLVQRTIDGDKEAYAELVSRYQGHVYGLAYSIVNNWADAQDIAQETFIRAYMNLGQLRDPARFAAWLRRVTFGVAMNWLKAFRSDLFSKLDGKVDLDSLEIPDFRPGPAEAAAKRDLADAVLRAIDSLPPKYRVPLTMFHLDGLSYKKVADFLDIPLSTVKVLIHRARAKLKEALAPYAEEEITPMVQEVFNEHKLPKEFARNVIAGVPTLGWGRGKDCTFAGALEAATAVTEHPFSYADLMGYSGLAFRVRWHEKWCPSCTVGEMGEEISAVARATGWRLIVKLGEGGPDMARFTGDIVSDLDQGRPVLVYPPDLNVAVAFGYDDAGETLLLRDYMKREDESRQPVAQLGFLLIFLGEHTDGLSRRDAFIQALRIAVHNWHRGIGTEGPGDYWYGKAAFEQWARDSERADSLTEQERTNLFSLNWLNLYTICDARKAAVSFLRDHASLIDGVGREALHRVASIYEEEAKLMAEALAGRDKFFRRAPERWTDEVRRREREILADLATRESSAVGQLQQALAGAQAGRSRAPSARKPSQ